ncbi:MAG: type II toxin-antitoxin system RelE/ParE family toxin [Clostridia bacterium]|nr:type II toxin-antitoxin system RelE/ParE family toxin [Clostridia bacterium]
MADVVLSAQAIDDLAQTKEYIAVELCNETAANNTIAKIIKSLRVLEKYPYAGASLKSIVNIETDFRYLVCGNYTAFYHVEKNEVQIARILYRRRDFMRILFGEPTDPDGRQDESCI